MDAFINFKVTGDKSVRGAFDDLQKALKASGASVKQFSDSLGEANAGTLIALQEINKAAGQLKSALEGFTGQAVKEFIAFDDALASVDAKANLTEEQLIKLKDAVQVTALATSQSPTSALQAADALIALGASADQASERVLTVAQLTDALRGVGATAEQSAKAIQLGASIFEKFGETAESVGDKIALISDTSAVASSTGLDEFLQVFSKAAPLASELGIGLNELLANFAALRDAGQAPEVAATSLKSLLGTILENKDELKALGVEVEDANGKFLGLENIFRQIGERGTTTTEIVDLFGKIGVSSALTLANSYDKVDAATARLADSQGSLQQKSDAINSSLQGQITLLQGSWQTALVDIGRSLSTVVAPGVSVLRSLVDAFIKAPEPIKLIISASAGLATAFAGLIAALTGAALAYKAFEASQIGAAVTSGKLTAAISAQIAALKGLMAAYAPYLAVAGAVAASSAIVATTYGKITAESRKVAEATDNVNEALNEYLGTTDKAKSGIRSFVQIIAGDFLNGLNNVLEKLPLINAGIDRWTQSFKSASALLAGEQFVDLQRVISITNDEYSKLAVSNQLATDAARDLLPVLEAQMQALMAFIPSTEAEILSRRQAIIQVRGQIEAIKEANKGREEEVATVQKSEAEKVEAAESTAEEINQLEEDKAAATEEALKLQEEAEKEFRDKQEALAKRAYENEKLLLEKQTRDRQSAIDTQIAAQEAAIESLNDQTDAIRQQIELTQLLGEENKLISDRRIQYLEAGIKSTQTQLDLIRIVNDENSTAEQIENAKTLAKQKGYDLTAKEKDLLNLIKGGQEAIRIEQEKRLDIQQSQERQELAFQQDLQRLELDRQIRQAKINELSARKSVIDAELLYKSQQIQLSEQDRLITQAKLNGASDAELTNLLAQRDLIVDQLGLTGQGIALAQQSAEIASGEVQDAYRLRDGFEEIAAKQTNNLLLQQQNAREQLAQTQEAERTAGALESAADAAGNVKEASSGAADEIGRAAKEAGLLEKNLSAAGRELSAFEKKILNQPLSSRTFDSSGKETTLAKRTTPGLGTQYFVGGKEVSAEEYKAYQTKAKESKTVGISGFVAGENATREELEASIKSMKNLKANTEKLLQDSPYIGQFTAEKYTQRDAEIIAELERRLQILIDAEAQANAITSKIGSRLLGGPVSPGSLYAVNEAGMEAFNPSGSNNLIPLLQPPNSLFSPSVPGTIIPALQTANALNVSGLLSEIQGLRKDLASRPVPTLNAPATFINEPSPLQTQINWLQHQMRSMRGI